MKKEKRVVSVIKAAEITGLKLDYIYKALRNNYIREYRELDAFPVDRELPKIGPRVVKYVDVCELWEYKKTIERLKKLNPPSKKWTKEEDNIVMMMSSAGATAAEISEEIDRTEAAIRTRIHNLKR